MPGWTYVLRFLEEETFYDTVIVALPISVLATNPELEEEHTCIEAEEEARPV